MTARNEWLVARIHAEGYCCLNGYLRLCRARDEPVPAMAENIGVSPDALWYHYRKLAEGKRPCQKQSECMSTIIQEIEAEKKPGEPGIVDYD